MCPVLRTRLPRITLRVVVDLMAVGLDPVYKPSEVAFSVWQMVPEVGIEQARRWAAVRVPVKMLDKVRIEVDVSNLAITIFECSPPWDLDRSPEWTRVPVARLRYTRTRDQWTLYWFDRNSDHHIYDLIGPARDAAVLLAEIDDDPTNIFWG